MTELSAQSQLNRASVALEEALSEMRLARQQSQKPTHLFIRARRAAVQAARAIALAVDLGYSEVWPQGPWLLSCMRTPDATDRPPATMEVGGKKLTVLAIRMGSGCDANGTIHDDTAFAVWINWICPYLRHKHACGKADAGAFDFPKVLTDEEGRLLGKNGKPLEIVETTDPTTGLTSSALDARPARVTDNYDETDQLEHWRCVAGDWIDACSIAIEKVRAIQEDLAPVVISGTDDSTPKSASGGLNAGAESGQNSALAPLIASTPRPFESGTMVFYKDRVDLCGAIICSGRRSETKRKILDVLRKTSADGSFVAYSGKELVEAAALGEKDVAAAIRGLRAAIERALLKEASITCGPKDVILSGGPGYRLSQRLSVQDGTENSSVSVNVNKRDPRERDERDSRERDERNERNERDPNERDGLDGRGDAESDPGVDSPGDRQKWILDELSAGRKLRIADVEKELSVSNPTARRDLAALKAQGQIEFVGKPKTGYYRRCQPKSSGK